jgi:hypothetical protein
MFHVEHLCVVAAPLAEEGDGVGFAGLDLHLVVIDGVLMEAGRGACLEASESDASLLELEAELLLTFLAESARGGGVMADHDTSAQEGPGGENDLVCFDESAFCAKNAANYRICDLDAGDAVFDAGQIGGVSEDSGHPGGVGGFVALGAVGLDGGTFASVQDAELESGAIGVEGHLSAEGVEFEDHVRFGDAPDGGIAGHSGGGIDGEGDEGGTDAHAGGGEGCFAAGVAGTDDEDVKM